MVRLIPAVAVISIHLLSSWSGALAQAPAFGAGAGSPGAGVAADTTDVSRIRALFQNAEFLRRLSTTLVRSGLCLAAVRKMPTPKGANQEYDVVLTSVAPAGSPSDPGAPTGGSMRVTVTPDGASVIRMSPVDLSHESVIVSGRGGEPKKSAPRTGEDGLTCPICGMRIFCSVYNPYDPPSCPRGHRLEAPHVPDSNELTCPVCRERFYFHYYDPENPPVCPNGHTWSR